MKEQKQQWHDRKEQVWISPDAYKYLDDYMHKKKLRSIGKALDRILFQKK